MSYPPPYGQPPVVYTDQKTGNSAEIIVAWILTVLTGFYLLPWAIAASRGKANSLTIGLITFLLGWTVIGWIVALLMSLSAHKVVRAY